MRNQRQGGRGSAFVEAALIFPLLFLIALGTADFSRLFYTGIEVTNAASAGVRYGAFSLGNSSDITGMQTAALNDVNITGMTATATQFCQCESGSSVACSGSCGVSGYPLVYVQVTARAVFQTLVNTPFIPSSTTVTRTAVMRAR